MSRLLLALLLLSTARAWAQDEPPSADDDEAAPTEKATSDKPAKRKPAPTLRGTRTEAAKPDDDTPNLNLSDKPAVDGKYQGVAPGAPALPPRAPKLPLKKGPQRMTWPGFQIKEGVPTVFLEVTAVPDYRVAEAPGAVTVTLKNTIVPLRNNRRTLDVTAFDSPVKGVETRSQGRDVRVTIKTKGADRPQHRERVEDAAGGFRMLVIELP